MTDESNSCSFSVWFRWYTVMLFLAGGGLVRTLLQALWLAGLWVTWSCCEFRDSEESYTWNSTMFNVTVTCLDWCIFMLKGEKSGARAFTPLLWGKCVIVKIGCLCDKCIQNCSTMPQCFKVKMLICTPPKDPFAALKFRRSTPVAIS